MQVAPVTLSPALGEGWTLDEVVDDEVVMDGVRLRRAGVTALGPGGVAVTGSAAELGGSPLPRAWFELLERAAIFSAASEPTRALTLRTPADRPIDRTEAAALFPKPSGEGRVASRSNGVALAPDWATACHRARLELVERDRVLRSWYGEVRPRPMPLPEGMRPATKSYTWRAARIGVPEGWSKDVEVVAVVAFGEREAVPLLRGFGAAADLESALRHAVGECVQGLAFLTRDDVPMEPPAPTPTPLFHLDLFLWPGTHERLRTWLDGEGFQGDPLEARDETATVSYVDLTPTWARGRFRVAQARSAAAAPLVFGPPIGQGALAHPIA